MRAMKRFLVAAGAIVTGFAVAGSATAQTQLTFQLNWVAGGANAGFAAAVGEGYYKDAGLDVTVVQGNGSGNTAQLVASGRAQLAYADAGNEPDSQQEPEGFDDHDDEGGDEPACESMLLEPGFHVPPSD